MPEGVYIWFYSFVCLFVPPLLQQGTFVSDQEYFKLEYDPLGRVAWGSILLVNTFIVPCSLTGSLPAGPVIFATKTRFCHLGPFGTEVTELVGMLANVLDLSSRGTAADHQLALPRVSWVSSTPPGKFPDYIFIRPRPLPSKPFRIYHLLCVLPFEAVSYSYWKCHNITYENEIGQNWTFRWFWAFNDTRRRTLHFWLQVETSHWQWGMVNVNPSGYRIGSECVKHKESNCVNVMIRVLNGQPHR
jgi:hypothetical protein